MTHFYQVANEYQKLMDEIANCDELSEDQLIKIEQVNDNLEDKAINVASIIKNLEADSSKVAEILNNIEERYDKITNKISSLKSYLKSTLEQCDIKEIKSPLFDIKIKYNPSSVTLINEELIPRNYLKEIINYRYDKAKIAEAFNNNIEVPGCKFERQTRLEIR